MDQCRIDKWLWSVRIFKTRSKATEACKKGKVKVNEKEVKPSRTINAGDIIEVDLKILTKTVKVTELLNNRISAKLVPQYLEDLTPQKEYDRPKLMKEINFEYWDRGSGRPTKKQRRLIDHLKKKN